MQRVLFYLPEGAVFDATEYYCNLVKIAFSRKKIYNVVVVDNLKDLKKSDILITIRISDPFKLKIKPKKIIHWFQGIAPEERIVLGNHSIRSYIASLKYSFLEKKILQKSDLAIFVSEEMRRHFERKYKLQIEKKSIVIPCYNIKLDYDFFLNDNRYKSSSFVYAGGVQDWQCVEEALQVFKLVQKSLPESTFVILTGQKEKAKELISKYNVPNVTVNYVKLKDLQNELSKYKYGFLLRKNNVINNVSTPTKMNSYLAAGLIPIYTSFIVDFEKNISLEQYEIKFNDLNINEISERILSFEKNEISGVALYDVYKNVFKKYYNDEHNISKLEENLKF